MAASEKDSSAKPAVTSARKPGARISQVPRRRARKLIMQALYQWHMAAGELIDIEAQFRAQNPGKIDWDFFHEVFPAIIANVEQLDQYMETFLDRSLSSLDPLEKALLRLGNYELTHRIDIPYRVVINESVELAKQFGATDSHKYINGVLDRMAPGLRAVEISANK